MRGFAITSLSLAFLNNSRNVLLDLVLDYIRLTGLIAFSGEILHYPLLSQFKLIIRVVASFQTNIQIIRYTSSLYIARGILSSFPVDTLLCSSSDTAYLALCRTPLLHAMNTHTYGISNYQVLFHLCMQYYLA